MVRLFWALRQGAVARRAATRALAGAAALGVALAAGACGSSTHRSPGTTTPTASQSQPTTGSSAPTSTGAGASTGGCTSVSAPPPRGQQNLRQPTLRLNPARRYLVKLVSNCGEIDIRLDVKRAPKTSASFASLVRRRFYDGLTFHRISAHFVIQGGDPNGDGSGGPGYQVVERPPANLQYTPGTVAMAKTPSDPPGASGSQFFIVTGTSTQLPTDYALVGRVVRGMSVVAAISAIPTNPPQDGMPTSPVVISRATLSVH